MTIPAVAFDYQKLLKKSLTNLRAANTKVSKATLEATDLLQYLWNGPGGLGDVAREAHRAAHAADGDAKGNLIEVESRLQHVIDGFAQYIDHRNRQGKEAQSQRIGRNAA